jgi:hypothetical protein
MKLRFTFLSFAFLLLIGHLAGAAQTFTPADPASASLAAIFSVPAAPAAPDGADAKLPDFAPAPTDRAVLCGSCSDSLCQGKHFRDFCKAQNGKTYLCQPAYVVCAANDCECWTGPLP